MYLDRYIIGFICSFHIFYNFVICYLSKFNVLVKSVWKVKEKWLKNISGLYVAGRITEQKKIYFFSQSANPFITFLAFLGDFFWKSLKNVKNTNRDFLEKKY